MPFSCESCGGHAHLMAARDGMLICEHCGGEHPFNRPPLLVVAGAGASGKSTLCQRVAAQARGFIALDADVFEHDLVSVVSPRHDYPAFWRTLMCLAHEIAQNGVTVVYFGITLPDQVLRHTDLAEYFDGIHILALVCDEAELRARINARAGGDAVARRIDLHLDINRQLADASRSTPNMAAVDASRPVAEVEAAVLTWIQQRVPRVISGK